MGGDLSWALSQRNPERFRGAIVMGSRASYRADAKTAALAPSRRYFFTMGELEDPERITAAKHAVTFLERSKLAHRHVVVPQGGHESAPLPTFLEALEFVLWQP